MMRCVALAESCILRVQQSPSPVVVVAPCALPSLHFKPAAEHFCICCFCTSTVCARDGLAALRDTTPLVRERLERKWRPVAVKSLLAKSREVRHRLAWKRNPEPKRGRRTKDCRRMDDEGSSRTTPSSNTASNGDSSISPRAAWCRFDRKRTEANGMRMGNYFTDKMHFKFS